MQEERLGCGVCAYVIIKECYCLKSVAGTCYTERSVTLHCNRRAFFEYNTFLLAKGNIFETEIVLMKSSFMFC